jgi:NYN domain
LDRCALFVDAGYVLAEGAQAVHGTRNRDSVSWDYAGLLKLLGGLSRDRTGLPLLRCYWYDTAAEGGRAAEHETLADVPGVKLRLSKARPNRKEGVEAEIRKDLSALARNRAVSDAVIVSAEEDLAPVIAEVQDLGIRAILLHISADGNWAISRSLRQECDDIIDIAAGHLRPYVDLIPGAEPVSVDVQLSGSGYRELPVSTAAASPGATSSLQPEQPAIAAPIPQLYPSPVAADFDRLGQQQLAPVSRDQQPVLPPQEPARFSGPAEPMQAGPGQHRADDQPPVLSQQYQGRDQGQPGPPAQPAYGQNGFGGGAGHASNGQGRGAPAGLGQHAQGVPGGMPPMNGAGPADQQPVLRQPQNGLAQDGIPQHGLQQPQNGMPQNGLSQNGVQQNGMPPGVLPQGEFGTQAAQPGSGMSQQGMQQPSAMPPGQPPAAPGQGLHQPSGPGPQPGQGQHGAPPGLPGQPPHPGQGQQFGHGPQLGQGMPAGPGYQPGSAGIGQPGQGLQPSQGLQPAPGPGPQRPGPGNGLPPGAQQNGLAPAEPPRPATQQRPAPPANGMPYPPDRPVQFSGQPPAGQYGGPPYQAPYASPPQQAPAPQPPPVVISVGEAVQSAHAEGFGFGEAVARDAPALWLEAVLARKPRMPSDLEARLLQGSALPIDSLLHDEVRHALRRGFWDALERSRH